MFQTVCYMTQTYSLQRWPEETSISARDPLIPNSPIIWRKCKAPERKNWKKRIVIMTVARLKPNQLTTIRDCSKVFDCRFPQSTEPDYNVVLFRYSVIIIHNLSLILILVAFSVIFREWWGCVINQLKLHHLKCNFTSGFVGAALDCKNITVVTNIETRIPAMQSANTKWNNQKIN